MVNLICTCACALLVKCNTSNVLVEVLVTKIKHPYMLALAHAWNVPVYCLVVVCTASSKFMSCRDYSLAAECRWQAADVLMANVIHPSYRTGHRLSLTLLHSTVVRLRYHRMKIWQYRIYQLRMDQAQWTSELLQVYASACCFWFNKSYTP